MILVLWFVLLLSRVGANHLRCLLEKCVKFVLA